MSNHQVIEQACQAISEGLLHKACQTINEEYPFVPIKSAGRRYSVKQKTQIFLRDGFIDRYSGKPLVFPPVLFILSLLMPTEFPYHPNWKSSECHMAYWHLYPTIDHIIPVARGGEDNKSNWVCTSQLKNSAKSNWLLEELGWELEPPGNLKTWNGLIFWFIDYVENNQKVLENKNISAWYKAGIREIKNFIE